MGRRKEVGPARARWAAAMVTTASCLVMGGCWVVGIGGDNVYHVTVINECGQTVAVDFGSPDGTEPYPVSGYFSGDLIATGETGTLSIMTQGDEAVAGGFFGGPKVEFARLSHKQLAAGTTITLTGDQCPPQADPHVLAPLVARYPFLQGADAATWTFARAVWSGGVPTHDLNTYLQYAVLTGDDAWVAGIVQRADDWIHAALPSLPDVVAADVPSGAWVRSTALNTEVTSDRFAAVHVFVNTDAGAVIITMRTGEQVPTDQLADLTPVD